MTKKKSYGLICLRHMPNIGIQILMIKKSVTYHFCEFVAGHYSKKNDTHLINLFANMTYNEKIDILSLKFPTMWYRIYKEYPDNNFLQSGPSSWVSAYIKKRNKFDRTFIIDDNGKHLKHLIASSPNAETPWEFPKGRENNSDERHINVAIREFTEETAVDESAYQVLWHLSPYVETYNDFGTTYQNVYYYAVANSNWEPKVKFYDKKQINEIADIGWVSKKDLKTMRLDPITYKRLNKTFEKIIAKYKNYTRRLASW